MGLVETCYKTFTLSASLLLLAPFACSARGRRRLRERYGFWGVRSDKPVVWFHAASVGEVNGLLPLLGNVREKFTGNSTLLSTTSPEGLEKGENAVDFVRLLPFDHPLWYRRAISEFSVEMCVVTETELWPAMLSVLRERKIATVLVNARVSDYSWQKYRALRPLIRSAMEELALVCAADPVSAERFKELGVRAERVRVCGNSKYDIAPRFSMADKALRKAKYFKNELPVLTLGSLRSGEEEIWFNAIQHAYQNGLKFNVVIAPRHMNRIAEFEEALLKRQIQFSKLSELTDAHVILVDKFGLLEEFYAISDLAFVGGTLADWGGHNPLEPAMYGVGLLLGPYTSKISEIRAKLEECGACSILHAEADALAAIGMLCGGEQAAKMGSAALAVYTEFAGATKRIMQALEGVAGCDARSHAL